MIGILLVAHGTLGESLLQCAEHVLGARPTGVQVLDVTSETQATMLVRGKNLITELNTGEGVLVLSDIYGATPCNTMCRLLCPTEVEGIAGVNLPMLLRVLTNRHLPLPQLLTKAVEGGKEGVVYITTELCDATAGC